MEGPFQSLLKAMLTKAPKPLEKTASKRQTSNAVASEDYAETQIHEDTSEDVSSTPKYVSP